MTRWGPLDLLGEVQGSRQYLDLLPHSEEIKVGEGVTVRVLKLEMLVALKEELGQEKDRAAIPILRKTLEQRKG